MTGLSSLPPPPGPDRNWGRLFAAAIVVMSGLLAASLALLPALLIGFVLLLRDVLGPTALPFGLVASVLAWLAPDWAARAIAMQAMLRGFDAGLAARLAPPLAIAACALAPAAGVIVSQRGASSAGSQSGASRAGSLLLRVAALALGAVAMRLGGALVAWCLLPGMCAFAWLAALSTDDAASDRADQPPGR